MPRKPTNGHKEMIVIEGVTVPPSITVPAPLSFIPEQGRRLADAMNGDIDAWAIQSRPGPGGRVLNYIPHGYVRDQLNKVFGPFWSEIPLDVLPGQKYDIVEYEVEREDQRTHVKTSKRVKEVITMIELRIRIYAADGGLISEETHAGSGGKIWENNISFADVLQSSQSEALKRAAFPLGRKFGLQLYYDDAERRAEWQEKFAPRVKEPPKNIAQLLVRLEEEGISDELFTQVTGANFESLAERDVNTYWSRLEEYRASVEE